LKADAAPILERTGPVDRILGRVRGAGDGPTLLCIAGIHGNEQAGVYGVRSVLARLATRADEMTGDFVALAGNRTALEHGRRFIDRDLNRAWTDERLEFLRNSRPGDSEDREQVELLSAIERVVDEARGPIYVLDLHTTSGPGAPFTTFGDTLPNRDFAEHFPVPMILGLEELVKGTLLAFLGAHGLVAVAFESGQHREPDAIGRAEAGIWIGVAAARLLPESRMSMLSRGRKALRRTAVGLPRALEMRHRHAVHPGDGFTMNPGYQSFQQVRMGEALARDGSGDVVAAEASRVLMPLYQAQGDDGFFLVREFSRFWLLVSYVMRRVRVERFTRWLPGVQRNAAEPDTVHVDKRVARWYAKQLFHLLGFREVEDAGERLVMRRRSFDDARLVRKAPPPERLS